MNVMFASRHIVTGNLSGNVAWYAKDVRRDVGEMYDRANWRKGWEKAKSDGWRVVRVVVMQGSTFAKIQEHLETHVSPVLAKRMRDDEG